MSTYQVNAQGKLFKNSKATRCIRINDVDAQTGKQIPRQCQNDCPYFVLDDGAEGNHLTLNCSGLETKVPFTYIP